MGTASSDCLSRQIRVLHLKSLNLSGCTQKNEEPQLGPEAQQQSALVGGTQQMLATASAQIAGVVKEFGIMDFPFIVATEQQADALNDGPAGQALLDMLPAKNLIGLGYWENGFRHVTN